MAKFRISYIRTSKDLTGGFGSTHDFSNSETFNGSLEDAISKAEAQLEALCDKSDTHFNNGLLIGIFEKTTTKILGFIPTTSERCVWRGGKTSKGALPVRVAT